MSMSTTATVGRNAKYSQTMEEAFPDASEWVEKMVPLGNTVLVQLRSPKTKTAGGIALPQDSQQFDQDQIRVAKVVAMGPLAYKNRETFEVWQEGAWVVVGNFVRVPAHAGIDRYKIDISDSVYRDVVVKPEDKVLRVYAMFATYNDFDMKMLIKGDPRDMIDYV